ncbi:MAG: hypothetical protein ACLU7D_04035 [Collinsella sp.]
MSQIAQDNPAALADPEAVARALSLEGGTCRVSLTRTTPDGTVIYYYALFGLVAMMSAEFAALSVVDLQPNLSGLGARRCVGGLFQERHRWASGGTCRLVAGLLCLDDDRDRLPRAPGSWLRSTLAGARAVALVGGAAPRLPPRGLRRSLRARCPSRAAKASMSGILTGLHACRRAPCSPASTASPAMALADGRRPRSAPAAGGAGSTPVKLICDMFNRSGISGEHRAFLSFAPARWSWRCATLVAASHADALEGAAMSTFKTALRMALAHPFLPAHLCTGVHLARDIHREK